MQLWASEPDDGEGHAHAVCACLSDKAEDSWAAELCDVYNTLKQTKATFSCFLGRLWSPSSFLFSCFPVFSCFRLVSGCQIFKHLSHKGRYFQHGPEKGWEKLSTMETRPQHFLQSQVTWFMSLGVQLDSSHLQVQKITVATVACHIFVWLYGLFNLFGHYLVDACAQWWSIIFQHGEKKCFKFSVVQGCESSTWRSSLDCDGREVISLRFVLRPTPRLRFIDVKRCVTMI